MQHDGRNNQYTDFQDTRLTLVLNREAGSDWSSTPVLRIQKYNDPAGSQSLRPGPEIPIPTKADGFRLIAELAMLLERLPYGFRHFASVR